MKFENFILFLVIIWILLLGFLLLREKVKNDDHLVVVKTPEWSWCGPQVFVDYKSASISVETPDGSRTYYGAIDIRPVKSCP